MTTILLSWMSNCTPMPEYSPWNCSSICAARCSGRNTECGSSVLSMPSIAPLMSFWLSGTST
jgi:hypothetical protein